MKKCRNCGSQLVEGDKFCKNCGKEVTEKKTGYFEKRNLKEREKQEILEKSYLKSEDVAELAFVPSEEIATRAVGGARRALNVALAMIILSVLAFLAAVAGILLLKYSKINDTLKVAFIILLFVVGAGAGAMFMDKLYYFRQLKAMAASVRAVKKVAYGKPPLICGGGRLYELNVKGVCPQCGAARHIEELDGMMYAVCNADREHVAALDLTAIMDGLFGKTEQAASKDAEGEDGGKEETKKIDEAHDAVDETDEDTPPRDASHREDL